MVDGDHIEIIILRPKSHSTHDQADAVREAVALRADVILTHMQWPQVAKKFFLPFTRDIPLVLWGLDDGSEDSIEALNRRGENVTGVTVQYLQLILKRFELMKEVRGSARRAAFVAAEGPDPSTDWLEEEKRRQSALIAAGAQGLGLDFAMIELPTHVSSETLVRVLRDARIDLVELGAAFPPELFGALPASRIVASGHGSEAARGGALLGGWTIGFVESAIRIAAKIIRGEQAAAIPVERAMQFGLAINLATARKLGITISQSLLLRATEVFE
ncbi:MAG TPA: ABC transporter substrate binding protein [Usitatibacter sp.]|nr:ABC transporter substrate binding protein [Usitatibacter sp.]